MTGQPAPRRKFLLNPHDCNVWPILLNTMAHIPQKSNICIIEQSVFLAYRFLYSNIYNILQRLQSLMPFLQILILGYKTQTLHLLPVTVQPWTLPSSQHWSTLKHLSRNSTQQCTPALHLTVLVYIILVKQNNSIYDLPLPSAPVLGFPKDWKEKTLHVTVTGAE